MGLAIGDFVSKKTMSARGSRNDEKESIPPPEVGVVTSRSRSPMNDRYDHRLAEPPFSRTESPENQHNVSRAIAKRSRPRSTKKSKAMKFKKSPDAPKRFKSAYMYFSTQKHKEIREELESKTNGKKVKTTEIAKMVSSAWRALSEEERHRFNEIARKDKERYELEKSLYHGPWKVQVEKLGDNDPTFPKRPSSAFLSFSNPRRLEIRKRHPEATNAEVSKILAEMWRSKSEDERKPFVEQFAREREEYKKAREDWEKNRERKKRAEAQHHQDQSSSTFDSIAAHRMMGGGPIRSQQHLEGGQAANAFPIDVLHAGNMHAHLSHSGAIEAAATNSVGSLSLWETQTAGGPNIWHPEAQTSFQTHHLNDSMRNQTSALAPSLNLGRNWAHPGLPVQSLVNMSAMNRRTMDMANPDGNLSQASALLHQSYRSPDDQESKLLLELQALRAAGMSRNPAGQLLIGNSSSQLLEPTTFPLASQGDSVAANFQSSPAHLQEGVSHPQQDPRYLLSALPGQTFAAMPPSAPHGPLNHASLSSAFQGRPPLGSVSSPTDMFNTAGVWGLSTQNAVGDGLGLSPQLSMGVMGGAGASNASLSLPLGAMGTPQQQQQQQGEMSRSSVAHMNQDRGIETGFASRSSGTNQSAHLAQVRPQDRGPALGQALWNAAGPGEEGGDDYLPLNGSSSGSIGEGGTVLGYQLQYDDDNNDPSIV